MAEETGGGHFALPEGADLTATFARVADELRRQYVIGFSPDVLDGRLHRIDVRVGRRGDEGQGAAQLPRRTLMMRIDDPRLTSRARVVALRDRTPDRSRRVCRIRLCCGGGAASSTTRAARPAGRRRRGDRREDRHRPHTRRLRDRRRGRGAPRRVVCRRQGTTSLAGTAARRERQPGVHGGTEGPADRHREMVRGSARAAGSGAGRLLREADLDRPGDRRQPASASGGRP